jgi:hypothetical protein
MLKQVELTHGGRNWLAKLPEHFILLSRHSLPLFLQEQKCSLASGELSPEAQEWSPYSPGHSGRHGNPPLYPNRPSVGESVGWTRRRVGMNLGLPGL